MMWLAEFVAAQKTQFLDDVTAGKGDQWTVAMGNEAGGASLFFILTYDPNTNSI